MRLSEAQSLLDAVNDPLIGSGLAEFFTEQRTDALEQVMRGVRMSSRDTLKESYQAGRVDAYENGLEDLRKFARDAMQKASQ